MQIMPSDVAVNALSQALVQTINAYLEAPYNVQLYDVEFILNEIYQEVSRKASNELQAHTESYNAAISKEETSAEEKEIETTFTEDEN